MKKWCRIILASISCLGIAWPALSLAHLPSTDGKTVYSLAPMLSHVTPSVGNIAVEKVLPQNSNPLQPQLDQLPPTKVVGVGSGVIIDAKKGYVVTNAHVVN